MRKRGRESDREREREREERHLKIRRRASPLSSLSFLSLNLFPHLRDQQDLLAAESGEHGAVHAGLGVGDVHSVSEWKEEKEEDEAKRRSIEEQSERRERRDDGGEGEKHTAYFPFL